jgi:dTDP-glucose 4,6-dehydratase
VGRRYLVTGGAGFIGRHFVAHVLDNESDAEVTVLDKLTYAGNPANLDAFREDARFRFIKGDICDPDAVAAAMTTGIDVVVNFAAETHVDRSISDPGSFLQTDVIGTYVLLEAVKARPGCRFVQISTDEVYGEILGASATEDAPLMPRNPYSASKAGADRLAYSFWATYGVPVCITRCSNNYGSHQYPEKLISLFVTNALDDQPLPVYGDGKNTREYIHARDHSSAVRALIEHDCFDGSVYNIGGGTEKSILDVTATILDALGKPESLIRYVDDRPGHDRRYAIDDARLRETTGWKPAFEFEDGIRETIRWYADHRSWWEPIKSGAFRDYYLRQYGDI